MEWMIYGGKLIWCDLLTSKIYQVEGTGFVSVRIFVNKTNTYRLKRWQYRPRAKLSIVSRMLRVFKNIQWWHLVFIYIHFYYVGKICTNITPTNLRAKWEDCRKAWNYITIDFHQNSAKVIAWRSVSFRWHVITYQTKKLFRFSVCILCPLCILQSTFCIWSAASSLTFVLTGIRGTNTIYFWSQLFAQHTQSTTRYLCVSLFDIFVLFRVNTLLSFCKNADITYNVSSNPLTPQKISLACIACLCLT